MRTISKFRPSRKRCCIIKTYRSSEETSCVRRLRHIAGYLGPPTILLLIGLLFSSTGRDDAHITYWSAYSLSRFGEILNYNGDRVEQSSSLLQVLLLSLIGLLSGAKMVSIGKISSIVFGIASLIAIYRLALKIDSRTAFPTAVLTGTSVYFIYWSYGGLESTLVAFTVLCLIMEYADYLNAPTRHHLHEH